MTSASSSTRKCFFTNETKNFIPQTEAGQHLLFCLHQRILPQPKDSHSARLLPAYLDMGGMVLWLGFLHQPRIQYMGGRCANHGLRLESVLRHTPLHRSRHVATLQVPMAWRPLAGIDAYCRKLACWLLHETPPLMANPAISASLVLYCRRDLSWLRHLLRGMDRLDLRHSIRRFDSTLHLGSHHP